MVAGVLATIVTFTLLIYLAIGLFTGGGIFIAWILTWAIGMTAANLARPNMPWKQSLLTTILLGLVIAGLNLAFFGGWF